VSEQYDEAQDAPVEAEVEPTQVGAEEASADEATEAEVPEVTEDGDEPQSIADIAEEAPLEEEAPEAAEEVPAEAVEVEDSVDADADADADDEDEDEDFEDARRARWTATGTGAFLTLAGLAASLMRLTGTAPALVPAAYALGAAVCALAGLLGSRGRTRRALWLLIVGVMVMAFGDQSD
jgi:hypothetical protein